MSLLFQVSRQQGTDRARAAPPTTAHDETARTARFAERALAAEADAFGAVRAASNAATDARERAETIEKTVAAGGSIGLVGIVAAAIPRLIPYEFAGPVQAIGTLLLLLPLGLVIRYALRDERRPEFILGEEAAQARAYALFAGRLGRALAPMASNSGRSLDPHEPIYGLVDGVEADLAKITQIAQADASVGRRHRRIVPRRRKVIVKTGDGRSLVGNLVDVSLSGAALSERLPRVEVGDQVMIGSHLATVARVWDQGMGLKFETMLSAASFNEDLVL